MRLARRIVRYVGCLGCCITFSSQASYAHSIDVAYIDFGTTTSSVSALTLTVALHPYQAFELARAGRAIPFSLPFLQRYEGVIAAYVQEHIRIKRSDVLCSWNVTSVYTPATEIEALGDGVTITGSLLCPKQGMRLSIESTLFLEAFPQQTSIVRFESPEGFTERLTLNRTQRRGSVDISSLVTRNPMPTPIAMTLTSPGNAHDGSGERWIDAHMRNIAQRIRDPYTLSVTLCKFLAPVSFVFFLPFVIW